MCGVHEATVHNSVVRKTAADKADVRAVAFMPGVRDAEETTMCDVRETAAVPKAEVRKAASSLLGRSDVALSSHRSVEE